MMNSHILPNLSVVFLIVLFFYGQSKAQLVPDFRINDDTTSFNQFVPKLDFDKEGNFVVTWQDYRRTININSPRPNIYFQKFDRSGNRLGNNVLVNEILDTSLTPNVAVAPNGNFGIVWIERNSFVKDRERLNLRLYKKNGEPITSPIRLNDTLESGTANPNIICNANGMFVISWVHLSLQSSRQNVFLQRVDSIGIKQGRNIIVSDHWASTNISSDITNNANGNFIICWDDNYPSALSKEIYFQMFDSLGNRNGVNTKVNKITDYIQDFPKISSDSAGNFSIVWESYFGVDFFSTVCRFYDSSGKSLGDKILVKNDVVPTSLASNKNGNIAIGLGTGQPSIQRIKDNELFGDPFLMSIEFPTDIKYLTDIKIYDNNVITVWQDYRNGNADAYCNIRSFSNPDSITSITQISNIIPGESKLYQNYPNPFNPSTKIVFELKEAGYISIKIFSVAGKEIETLIDQRLYPGKYEVFFNAREYTSGVYFYTLQTENYRETKKMLFVK